MKFGMKKTSTAVLAMKKLMQLQNGKPVTLAQLSEDTVSLSYLEQIFSQLKKSGLVYGVRGPGGGYVPERDNYSVGEVIRAMDAAGVFGSPAVLAALDNVSLAEV